MIKIIDNFFKDEDLKKVQDFALNKAFYTPRFFDDGKPRSKENHYGNRFALDNDKDLLEFFKKQSETKFNLEISKIHSDSGLDQRNLDHFKPHTDPVAKINILIMIYGPTAVSNGTVFYTNSSNNPTEEIDVANYELDIHVGFRPNRAVLFPSNRVHSQHASITPNLMRYTSTLFVEEYKQL